MSINLKNMRFRLDLIAKIEKYFQNILKIAINLLNKFSDYYTPVIVYLQ